MKRFALFLLAVSSVLVLKGPAYAQFQAEMNYLGPSIGLSFLGTAPQFGVNYERRIQVDFGKIGIGGVSDTGATRRTSVVSLVVASGNTLMSS